MKKSKPYIKIQQSVSDRQKDEILALVTLCNSFDNIKLSFPFEENIVYFLIYNDEYKLLHASCLYYFDAFNYEISSFTHPDSRKQGLFTCALNEILAYLKKAYPDNFAYIRLSFTVFASSVANIYILPKIGAKKEFEELGMQLYLKSTELSAYKQQLYLNKNIKITSSDTEGVYVIYIENDLLGEFAVFNNRNGIYFYHFSIEEKYRAKGLGKCVFLHILEFFIEKGITKVSLQVRKENTPAFNIYTFFGFEITERLVSWIL